MKIYGYARKDYPIETTKQLKMLITMNCDEVVIEEPLFFEKKELEGLMNKMQPKDTLIVYDLLVFGQEIVKFERIIHTLSKSNIRLISVNNHIDTETDDSFFNNVTTLNAMHLELIKYKTKNNIAKARKRGVKVGRPKIEAETISKIRYLHEQKKYSLRKIAEECAVSVGTVYKYVKSAGNEKLS